MQKTKPVGMNIPVDPLRFSTWSTFNGTIIATSTENSTAGLGEGGYSYELDWQKTAFA